MTKEQARNVLDEGGNYWHIYPYEIEIILDGSFTVAELEAAIFLIKEKQGNQTRIKNSGQYNCPDCRHIAELSHRGPCRHCKPGAFQGTHFSPAYDEPEEEKDEMDGTEGEQ